MSVTFQQLGEAYLVSQSFQKSRDKKNLLHRVRWWYAYLGPMSPEELIDESKGGVAVLDALDALEASGKAVATQNRYRCACMNVINYGKSRKRLPKTFNLFEGIPQPSEKGNERQRCLTDPEVERLLAECRISRNRRLWLAVKLSLETGIRHRNLVEIKYEDIDLESSFIRIARTKNGSPHIAVIVSEELQNEFIRLFKSREWSQGELIFGRPSNRYMPMDFRVAYRNACTAAGLRRDVVWHTLRHTAASAVGRATGDLRLLMDFGAWKSPSMALRYNHLHLDERVEKLKKVFKR